MDINNRDIKVAPIKTTILHLNGRLDHIVIEISNTVNTKSTI